MSKTALLLVNFGGPRALSEVEPFLKELLTDQDVVRTQMPKWLHRLLFQRVAKKRSVVISKDYELIGGKSPIYEDTEAVAEELRKRLDYKVITFHRYLGATHNQAIEEIENLECDEIIVFPMFPQFTYATTGSIARLFSDRLSNAALNKMRWIKSYPTHPAFVDLTAAMIRRFLDAKGLNDEETILLFSAHGVPQKFIESGDLYQAEVSASYDRVMRKFPKILGKLCYQSKFGPGEWLKPYTIDLCERVMQWHEGRLHVVFVPISFTSDHIETLFEIEYQYMTVIREQGLEPYRVPAFNRSEEWIEAIISIVSDFNPVTTQMLVRE
jgi:ferrochelatase